MRCAPSAQKFGADAPLPDYFVTAQTLTPGRPSGGAGGAAALIDSAISKTINVPEDISFEAFEEVYLDAYAQGCKGCTTYRPNDDHRLGALGRAPAPGE